jgi:hypothetical protein
MSILYRLVSVASALTRILDGPYTDSILANKLQRPAK